MATPEGVRRYTRPCVTRPLTAAEFLKLGHEILRPTSPAAARDFLFFRAATRTGRLRVSQLLDAVQMGEFWDFTREAPLARLDPQERAAAIRWFSYLKRLYPRGRVPYGPHELLMQSRKRTSTQFARVTRQRVYAIIKSAARRCGIEVSRIGAESLRKTVADRLERESPFDWGRKKRGLGHKTVQSTMDYYLTFKQKDWNLRPEDLRRTAKAVITRLKAMLSDGTIERLSREELALVFKDISYLAQRSEKYSFEAEILLDQLIGAISAMGMPHAGEGQV